MYSKNFYVCLIKFLLAKEQEIIRVTEQLLFALTSGDFETFSRLSDSLIIFGRTFLLRQQEQLD